MFKSTSVAYSSTNSARAGASTITSSATSTSTGTGTSTSIGISSSYLSSTSTSTGVSIFASSVIGASKACEADCEGLLRVRECLSISEEVWDVARDYHARVPATCWRGVSLMGHFAVAFAVGVSGCGLVDDDDDDDDDGEEF